MNFQNDSAYMLVMEECAKGRAMTEEEKKAFMAALLAEAEENTHKEAMDTLVTYLADAVEYGMYYDVMRFVIKCMIYEDTSFDYAGFYDAMKEKETLAELLEYGAQYAAEMKKKNGPVEDEMAAFFFKTKNIFSDDFGRFLYGTMKGCSPSYNMAITEAEVDAIAKSVNKKARPGMLLCLIDYVYAGRTKNVEIFWYALRRYVLPVLGTAKITKAANNEQVILRNLISQYAFYIYNVVYLKYILAKEEGQSEDDQLDPLVKYWSKDEEKAAIEVDIVRFYTSRKEVLREVLSERTYAGFEKMIEVLR